MPIRSICRALAVLFSASAVVLTASCAPKHVKKASSSVQASGVSKSTAAVEAAGVPDIDVTEASLRGADFVNADGLSPIYFEYDSASLKPEALDALKKNAERLKEHPEQDVLVAGYCDARGTVEYNLALGQKRARQVREYYMRLGVSGKSVATISYGKESAVCVEDAEACWSQNRRAETRVRAHTASAGSAHQRGAQ